MLRCTDSIVEGRVKSINRFYASFDVAGHTRVHMSLLMTQIPNQKLPSVGSIVKVKNGHQSGRHFVLCKTSVLEGNFVIDCPHTSFINLVARYRLGAVDIFKIEEIKAQIEYYFTSLEVDKKSDILMALVSNATILMLEKGNAVFARELCLNRITTRFFLGMVRSCKYVEIKSNKYVDFPYWSYGVHPCERNNMLFGLLEMQPVYGFYMIKDCHYQIVCIIITDKTKQNELQISQLENSYVLIERYTVITEIYNDSKIPNVEYLIVNVDNIHLIYSTKQINSMFGVKPKGVSFPHVVSFVVRKKSTVTVGSSNLPELLLHIFLRFVDAKVYWQEVFLVIPSKYVSMYLRFREGNLYLLHHNSPLKEITYPELTRVKNLKVFEVEDRDCHFEPVNMVEMPLPDILTVEECLFHIQHVHDWVSFRGIIKYKRFSDPLPSRTTKKQTVYGFGTPGSKVHQIVFAEVNTFRVIYLDCYLNNWENMLMPLGLVPQMEVIVRNVVPQSKKYLKATIFTTFEVVSYKPVVNFSTVNLYKDEEEVWGSATYLSQGGEMPYGVLVWGRVMSIFMLKLSIITRCATCQHVVNRPVCIFCRDTKRELDFTAKFKTLDQYGQSSVMTKSHAVLRTFMRLSKTGFEEFLQTFPPLGIYHYNFFEQGNPEYLYITRLLEKINEKKIYYELKCRKLGGPNLPDAQRPMWNCLDARLR